MSDLQWLPVMVAVIAALPGLYAVFQQRKTDEAEVAATMTRAAIELVDEYREENKRLRERLRDKEVERQVLHETLIGCIGRNKTMEAELARRG